MSPFENVSAMVSQKLSGIRSFLGRYFCSGSLRGMKMSKTGLDVQYSELEISILHHSEELIKSEFKIEADRLYHYTSSTAADAIATRQVFHSSSIRSSSDSLEFSAPMAACRDCVCLTQNFFAHQTFPVVLFKHFNEEASFPSARAYFISLSGNSNSAHLKSMYGDVPLEFKVNTDATDFTSHTASLLNANMSTIRRVRFSDCWTNGKMKC